MMIRSRSRRSAASAAGFAVLVASLLLGAFGGTAFGSSPPKNTALPTISPATPHVGQAATATTGTWNSEAPAQWFEGGSTKLKEGEKVNISAESGPIAYAATVGGVSGSISCSTEVTGASLENPSGGTAGVGNAEIIYKTCQGTGGWSSCTVSVGTGEIPVKLALSTTEGKPKISISPVGANLGTFTLSGCLVEGGYKVLGVINGFYDNAASWIDFNAGTSGGGSLRLNSLAGPKASATGRIALRTATGGFVRADSLTYTYAWNRCASGKCSAITGATTSTYTPGSVDLGKKLTVSVTATDAIGGTTATSAESGAVVGTLSWYACGKWGEPGVYENSNCTKTGASNPYSWLRPSTTSFTSSNFLEGGGSEVTRINWTEAEVAFEIDCTGSSGEGTLRNAATKAEIEAFKLTLSSCWYSKPGGAVPCEISSSGFPADHKLVFKTLKAVSPAESAEVKPELTVSPETGATLVEFSASNCSIAGSGYKFTGWFPALFHNEGGYIGTTSEEVKASKGMKFMGAGPVAGINSVHRVLSEGEKPVKLDTAQ